MILPILREDPAAREMMADKPRQESGPCQPARRLSLCRWFAPRRPPSRRARAPVRPGGISGSPPPAETRKADVHVGSSWLETFMAPTHSKGLAAGGGASLRILLTSSTFTAAPVLPQLLRTYVSTLATWSSVR